VYRIQIAICLVALTCLSACQKPALLKRQGFAPVADKRPTVREYHGQQLHDDYYWLRDPSYPEVVDKDILDYLRAENNWYEQAMAKRATLVDDILAEMKGRLEQDEVAVPWQLGDHIYRWRYTEGADYRLWERKPVSGGEYRVILDEAAEADGKDYFSMGAFEVSPDQRYLAWTADLDGSEREQLIVDDLVTGERYSDGPHNVSSGQLAWANDSKTLVYAPVEPDGWYTQRVKTHQVGSSSDTDEEIFYNPDREYFLVVSESTSREYIIITVAGFESSEVFVIPAAAPLTPPRSLAPRRLDHRYFADHGNGQFYIITNDQHINNRIVTAPESDPVESNWTELIPPSDDTHYLEFDIFEDFLAIQEMSEALQRIRIHNYTGAEHYVEFPEDVYTVSLGNNPDPKAGFLRINYESLTTPDTVYDYTPGNATLTQRQQQVVPSGYDPRNFVSSRIWVSARDGVKVPVSLVRHLDVVAEAKPALILYGYGAYATNLNPRFSSARLSLLERGAVFALAHVRGGGELGYQWYLDGKRKQRNNTFNDFVDVSRHLAELGYGAQERIAIHGGSAGGELVGAALLQAPGLYAAAVLEVPFVDVLNTMLDASLPLTPPEWKEWGHPIESAEDFALIRSYSPYDNIESRDYPAMMVTGGLNDPRVTYWEPAKWTAKMRALKTDNNELIMKINMGAGHQGQSGKFSHLREVAETYAFMLSHLQAETVKFPVK